MADIGTPAPKLIYNGILNLSTSGGNITSTLQPITDGDNNSTALSLATNKAKVTGSFEVTGNHSVGGDVSANAFTGDGSALTGLPTPSNWTVESKTANYTASDKDYVLADATSGIITITLPTAAANLMVGVKKVDSSANEVTVTGGGTIDGAASKVIGTQYDGVTLICDGTNWFII